MATYADLIAQFTASLNRRDAAPSQIQSWLQQSVQRAQSLLDVPASERLTVIDIPISTNQVPVPADLLKLIAISFEGRILMEADLTRVRHMSKHVGCPEFFARLAGQYFIAPAPHDGSQIEINYQGDFSQLMGATDSNWLTNIAGRVIIYGALSEAGIYYSDARQPDWEQKFTQGIGDLNAQAAADELTHATISPGINFSHQGNGYGWGYY